MSDKRMNLLISASEDLNAANWAHSRKRYPVVAYLSQQVIEKSLKTAKKFQNVTDNKDLWSHNLIDCLEWNVKLKNKYKSKIMNVVNDQEESRYFNVEDNILPWDKYNGENTFEKLNLAKEILAVSLAYMQFPCTENYTLIEYSHHFRKPNPLNKLISETIMNLKRNGDYEIDFINSLKEVLMSKNRFYHESNFSPLLHLVKEDYENSLLEGPEYQYPDFELGVEYLNMYNDLIKKFKIKKIKNIETSKNFFELARYDLVTSHMLNYDEFYNLSLFYVSQSIEKSLKSILNLKTPAPYMNGHNLVKLCNQCLLEELSDNIKENPFLNMYNEFRYNDGNEIQINCDDIEFKRLEAITLAERIYFTALHIRKKYKI
jgi:HEPN domain-containing protein